MARINDLIRQLEGKDPAFANEISREMRARSERRAFGLNFERHTPEQVELPGRPVRKGDKVHILPPRGEFPKKANQRIWFVDFVSKGKKEVANLIAQDDSDQTSEVPIEDLVVVAEFRDPIYPGLVSTGKVERGGDKPFHTVIDGENFHALEALLFTHRGKVDTIYIDPPYNTGAKDWKYNNNYVESEDIYRHSKWLAFIERRLLLAKKLLRPDDSVLLVTIDEKEFLRLGLLLHQTFPEAAIQMVSSVINPFGVARAGQFARVDEYIFIVTFGSRTPALTSIVTLDVGEQTDAEASRGETFWFSFMRAGSNSSRDHSPGCFYPFYVSRTSGEITEVGQVLPKGHQISDVGVPDGCYAAWPVNESGSEAVWQASREKALELLSRGLIRTGRFNRKIGRHSITYVREGTIAAIERGELAFDGLEILPTIHRAKQVVGKTIWNIRSHNATSQGTKLLGRILPGRKFPYPKSLYAVEDLLRYFVSEHPEAVVLDFFAGSGTTAHAVMRLNKQDGGKRTSISITNNEVSSDEQELLRSQKLRPGDADWEKLGICEYITKPRLHAAVTGKDPTGEAIQGSYKFTDEFPMAQGFEENAEFFTLTYEAPMRVQSNREFARIAPLLWLRAGSRGRRIDSLENGWGVTDGYGVLEDLDKTDEFLEAMNSAPAACIAYIVTDEDRLFESVTRDLPTGVEPVRLYQSYLSNFEIDAMRRVR